MGARKWLRFTAISTLLTLVAAIAGAQRPQIWPWAPAEGGVSGKPFAKMEQAPETKIGASDEIPYISDDYVQILLSDVVPILLEIKAREGLVERIDAYLERRRSPLAGYGRVFVAEGERTGINPFLSVAIAGAESTFGRACFAPHNAWGMLAYPRGFGSWEEGIRANFDWLSKYYGTPQNAYDCPGYCIPDHPWMERVQAVIEEI